MNNKMFWQGSSQDIDWVQSNLLKTPNTTDYVASWSYKCQWCEFQSRWKKGSWSCQTPSQPARHPVSQPINQSPNKWINQPANQLINQPRCEPESQSTPVSASQSTHQTYQPTSLPTSNKLVNHPINQTTDKTIRQLENQQTSQLTYQPTKQTTSHPMGKRTSNLTTSFQPANQQISQPTNHPINQSSWNSRQWIWTLPFFHLNFSIAKLCAICREKLIWCLNRLWTSTVLLVWQPNALHSMGKKTHFLIRWFT